MSKRHKTCAPTVRGQIDVLDTVTGASGQNRGCARTMKWAGKIKARQVLARTDIQRQVCAMRLWWRGQQRRRRVTSAHRTRRQQDAKWTPPPSSSFLRREIAGARVVTTYNHGTGRAGNRGRGELLPGSRAAVFGGGRERRVARTRRTMSGYASYAIARETAVCLLLPPPPLSLYISIERYRGLACYHF